MLSFLGLNKITLYIVAALTASGILFTSYYTWKRTIRQQALLEYNMKQLQQVIEDQKKYNENMIKLTESQNMIIEEMNKKNEAIKQELESLESYLNSEQAIKDSRASSDVLKRTIRELSK